jgi:membrane-bound metal-dependent hydrolase YbcI (DUF457 family)
LFVFGHVGLTWGGALLLARLARRPKPFAEPVATRRPSGAGFDFRLVILGSMLPDIVDKPLGVFVLSDEVSTGRAFAHSLAFVSAIALAALLRPGTARRLLAPVVLGTAAHLVFDRMWMHPETLLWPLLGWRFERQDVSGWVEQMLEKLFSDPYTYVSEAAGAAVVVALLASLIRARGLRDFVLNGRMGPSGAGRPKGRLAAGQERPQEL